MQHEFLFCANLRALFTPARAKACKQRVAGVRPVRAGPLLCRLSGTHPRVSAPNPPRHPLLMKLTSEDNALDDLTHELAIDSHDDREGTLPRGLRVALTLLWQNAGLMRGHVLEKLLQLLIQCLCLDSHSKVAENSVACLQASLAAPYRCKGKAFGP